MKKNILVILVVISVVGVVLYLLKDKLKVLLGERAEGEEIPGEEKKIVGPWVGRWPSFGLKGFLPGEVTMGTGITLPSESPARWLREEIAPVLKPLYPARYIAITKGLFAYLVKGETALPPEQQLREFKTPATNGPYSWALPQF